jgi:peptidoglycan/LPS O-acetylase OafA/YrhL
MSSAAQTATSDTRHLDALRIVAAFAIVVLHYCEYAKNSATAHAVFNHIQHFNLFVDLFFVISGYVIAKQYLEKVDSYRATIRFLWRRIARIYPLHLLTLAFYLAIAAALQLGLARGENPARYPVSDIPAQLLMLHAVIGQRLTFNFPSWSLSAEMVCYLLFPLLAAAVTRRRSLALLACFAALLANSIAALVTDAGPWTDWINRGGAFRALPSFTLGLSLYLFRTEIGRRPEIGAPLTPVLLSFLALGGLLPSSLALVAVYAIAILAVRTDLIRQDTILLRSGVDRWSDLTYSVYMLHIPVATLVLTIAGRYLSLLTTDARLILIPVALAVLMAASYLSLRYFETPTRRALYALYDQRRAADLALSATTQGGNPR